MSASSPPPLPPPPPANLDGALNAFGLDWHYSDVGQPNLLYPLTAVDGVSVQQGKTLLNLHLYSPPTTPPLYVPHPPPLPCKAQLELVEKESVIRSLPLHRLLSCDSALTDPHTLQLVHLTTPSTTPRVKHSEKAQSTCGLLSLTFPSLDDLQDIATILRAAIHCAAAAASSSSSSSQPCPSPPTPLSPPPPMSPLLSRTIHGQVCIHQGWVDKQSSSSSLSYAKRYLRLFPNRLLLYRQPSAAYPVNILPLTTSSLTTHATTSTPRPRIIHLHLHPSPPTPSSSSASSPTSSSSSSSSPSSSSSSSDARDNLLWRCPSTDEQQRWVNALATEGTASFRTRVGALLTPGVREALAAGGGGGGGEGGGYGMGSRRGSVSGAPPLPPLPHPALTAVALSITATHPHPRTSPSSSHSSSPRMSRQASFSSSFAGNPLLHDTLSSSPAPSPPLNAALFSSQGGGGGIHPPLPRLELVGGGVEGPPLSLSSLLGSPRSFFHYLLHLSSLPLLFPSPLPSPPLWHRLTPQPFLKKRGKLMLHIDSALSSYHLHLSSSSTVWHSSRLFMVDELEQSGSGQVHFSFPGFDAQRFDVGKLSVIACHQLFACQPHPLLFTRRDYDAAIESSSPAKEMMQSSPDVQALFDSGQVDEARALSYDAQKLVLHHCALASHVKSRTSTSLRHTLRANDVIPWAAVLHSASPSTPSPPLCPRNQGILESFLPVAYIANPSLHTLQLLLAHCMACEPSPSSAAAAAASAPPPGHGGHVKGSVGGGGVWDAAAFSSAPGVAAGQSGGVSAVLRTQQPKRSDEEGPQGAVACEKRQRRGREGRRRSSRGEGEGRERHRPSCQRGAKGGSQGGGQDGGEGSHPSWPIDRPHPLPLPPFPLPSRLHLPHQPHPLLPHVVPVDVSEPAAP